MSTNLRWSLQQAHLQRHAGVTHLCPHEACQEHPHPCYAQLPSLPGSLAVVCRQMTGVVHGSLLQVWTQRLRLLVIAQLWDAYCRARSRPEQPTQAAHIAARVTSAARSQMTGCSSAQSFGSELGCSATGSGDGSPPWCLQWHTMEWNGRMCLCQRSNVGINAA